MKTLLSLLFVTLGSLRAAAGFSIATDAAGNVYSVGIFYGTVDFDPSATGTLLLTAPTNTITGYLTKQDASGAIVWARKVTDSGGVNAITLDAAGNIYLAGILRNTQDFDPGPGSTLLTSAGQEDVYVLKLDPSGALLWARSMGSGERESCIGVAVDGSGNVFTAGSFVGAGDFDPGPGTAMLTPAVNGMDVFIVKLDASGSFAWARQTLSSATAANNDASPFTIGVDASGAVFCAGEFSSQTDFDPGPGTSILTPVGSYDAFVWKLDAAGALAWAGRFGGPGSSGSQEKVNSMAVDPSGDVYLGGTFYNAADFDPGPATYTMGATGSNAFMLKLNNGGGFQWATWLSASSAVLSLAADATGVYAIGRNSATADFDPGTAVVNLPAGHYLWKLTSAGALGCAAGPMTGALRPNQGQAMALGPAGALYVTGNFFGTVDFNPGVDSFKLTGPPFSTQVTTTDDFVLKLTTGCGFGWAVQFSQAAAAGLASLPGVASSVTLVPNPARGVAFLQSEEGLDGATVRLRNAVGQVVNTWQGMSGTTLSIDVSGLAVGVYIVEVESRGIKQWLRLVKR